MNNHRLLAGMLCAILLSGGVCASGQNIISLEEIFEMAEKNSAQLLPDYSAEQEADKQISISKSAYLPDIIASLTLSYNGDGFTTKRDYSDYQKAPIPHLGTGIGVSVNQPIFTGGAIKHSVGLAEHKSFAARFVSEIHRNSLRFQLAGLYLDIFKYRNLQMVLESNIISANRVLNDMQARQSQGTILRNDIIRYELLLENLELEKIKIINMLEILNNNLVKLAGCPDGTRIIPDSTILERSYPDHSELWWRQEAAMYSPELKLARNGVEICRKAEKLERSSLYPKVGLQAAWTLEGPILTEVPPINRNLSYWFVGVGINYELSSLYKTNKILSKSRFATKNAVEKLDVAKQNIDLVINADYICYLEAFEELKTREKSVELAERNYQTVSMRYSEGLALITDLLDAADSRLSARQLLVNARIDIIYYYYKLLFVSGKL